MSCVAHAPVQSFAAAAGLVQVHQCCSVDNAFAVSYAAIKGQAKALVCIHDMYQERKKHENKA
jgi:hypothetical protein